jgi:hypothetical protein
MQSTSRHQPRQTNFDETCSDCLRLRLSDLAPNRLFLPERLDDIPSKESAHGGSDRGRQVMWRARASMAFHRRGHWNADSRPRLSLAARPLLRLAAFIPEFATGPTGNFVSPFLYGHPNSAAAVDLERRVQNDRPRASCTAAGYVENPISRDSKSVTSQRTAKLIDAQFTHWSDTPLLLVRPAERAPARLCGAAARWRIRASRGDWTTGGSDRIWVRELAAQRVRYILAQRPASTSKSRWRALRPEPA